MKKTKSTEQTDSGLAIGPVSYEVKIKIEMDGMIYYPTHRLKLTPERAAEINVLQPGTLELAAV